MLSVTSRRRSNDKRKYSRHGNSAEEESPLAICEACADRSGLVARLRRSGGRCLPGDRKFERRAPVSAGGPFHCSRRRFHWSFAESELRGTRLAHGGSR